MAIQPMQSIELNFDPTAYDSAQSELFEQLGKLQEARNKYDALKNQINNFWKGAEAESARETIQSNIKLVDQAYENVKKQQQTYKTANEEAAQKREDFKSAMTEAKAAVEALFT